MNGVALQRANVIDACAANGVWERSLTAIIGVGDASHGLIRSAAINKAKPRLSDDHAGLCKRVSRR